MKKLFFILTSILGGLLHSAEHDVVILGGGIAGLTAAVQASQAGLDTVVISGPSPGGIITQSHLVQNWPAEIEISGTALAEKLQKQVEVRNVPIIAGSVIAVDFSKQPFQITVKDDATKKTKNLQARTSIVTLGAKPKLLNVPGENQHLFSKIFTCAACDGFKFKNQTVAVVGGGDSALMEAHYLSNLAKKVHLIVRKDHFKTLDPKRKESILSCPRIEVHYNTSVSAFDDEAEGLLLTLQTSSGAQELKVQGAFLAIGSLPNTDLVKGQLELDPAGYIVLKHGQETSIKGVFAAGDVSDPNFKQAMTAAGDATKAALQAQALCTVKPQGQTAYTPSLALQEISSLKAFRTALVSSKKPTIAYFYSERCPPCRRFRPTYLAWANEFKSKADFIKLNAENATDCFQQYQVSSIPTVVIFDQNGQEMSRATGIDEIQALRKQIQQIK